MRNMVYTPTSDGNKNEQVQGHQDQRPSQRWYLLDVLVLLLQCYQDVHNLRGKFSLSILIACRAKPSVIGVERIDVKASIA